MKVIKAHVYGTYIFMRLELDGKEYELYNCAGADCSWKHFVTSADDTPDRDRVIAAFYELI